MSRIDDHKEKLNARRREEHALNKQFSRWGRAHFYTYSAKDLDTDSYKYFGDIITAVELDDITEMQDMCHSGGKDYKLLLKNHINILQEVNADAVKYEHALLVSIILGDHESLSRICTEILDVRSSDYAVESCLTWGAFNNEDTGILNTVCEHVQPTVEELDKTVDLMRELLRVHPNAPFEKTMHDLETQIDKIVAPDDTLDDTHAIKKPNRTTQQAQKNPFGQRPGPTI